MRLTPIERRMARVLQEPPSARLAARTIVAATAFVVVVGGVLMRVVDRSEYPSVWKGMWWALQTVTTVGYGDVTPKHVGGRLVAAFVMFEGIAFLAIVTAAITSTFVTRVIAERAARETGEELSELQRIESRLDSLDGKLDRLEAALRAAGEK
ncbi:MAG TPA: potassium channel family protein [Gaiellaceae bacterium]|nr:potassium channel family protein [Gaiellaceae bacterium]